MAFPSPLLVVGAVPHETKLVEHVLSTHPKTEAPWRLRASEDCFVLTCGIGPANAAGALAWVLSTETVGAVVNLGSAGSFDPAALPLEAVAIVREDRFVDLGTRLPDGSWQTGEDLRLMLGTGADNTLSCHLPPGSKAPEARAQLSNQLGFPVELAGATTVHHVSGTPEDAIERRRVAGGALVESMEGAALALVAHRFGVPFYQLRGISNAAGAPRGGWRFKEAGRNAQHLLLALMGKEPA